jgi:hypothetical protein
LFARLNTKSSKVIGEFHQRQRAGAFRKFLTTAANRSRRELEKAIRRYVAVTNAAPKPSATPSRAFVIESLTQDTRPEVHGLHSRGVAGRVLRSIVRLTPTL